jgi:hypothetical protein
VVDDLDVVAVRVSDERQSRPALAHPVRRALGLDPLSREALQSAVEVVDADSNVAVARA